jgi:hypothetical protein
MISTKILAAAAVLSALIATPVLAQDMNVRRAPVHRNYDANAYDHQRDTNFWPAEVAAGIVGGAIGTAGALATAPFTGDGYGYQPDYRYSRGYAERNGFVCQPGTLFRGEDGRTHICQ